MNVTLGLDCAAGEELQLDWLELSETPWGEKAYVLVVASALHAIDYVTQPSWRAAPVSPPAEDRPARALYLGSNIGRTLSESLQTGSSGQQHLYPIHFDHLPVRRRVGS